MTGQVFLRNYLFWFGFFAFLACCFVEGRAFAWGKKKTKEKKVSENPAKLWERAQKHIVKGRILKEKGKCGAAIEEFRKALLVDPSIAEPYLELGNLYTDLQAHSKSAEMLETGLPFAETQELEKESIGKGYCQLAINHMALGMPDKASGDIVKALSFLPNDPAPQKTLARIYNSQGKIDAALKAFKEALKLDPGNVETWLEMGRLALEHKYLDEANEAYHGLEKADSMKAEEFLQEMKQLHVKPVQAPASKVSSSTLPPENDPYAE